MMTEQEKREKVIKGLECIISSGNAGMRDDCANCIYPGGGDCLAPALRDALALLKAQEARLVTEADFENVDAYGYLPVWVEYKDDSEVICDCITKTAITDTDSGNYYRYWTSCPTQAERDVTSWE